ncbi:MAG: hypothetical protein EAZ37_10375 [Burkholderiales bacterium]|nr:MAG: hypothetical protein EAZ37_10375 [Burkholderiales bacterium]
MIRHFWHGGYSLGASFWLMGVVGSVALAGILAAVLFSLDDPSLLLILAMSVLSMAYNAWIVVGIWRSAGSYSGRQSYAYAARALMAVFAIYSVASLMLMFYMLLLGGAVMLNPPFIK